MSELPDDPFEDNKLEIANAGDLIRQAATLTDALTDVPSLAALYRGFDALDLDDLRAMAFVSVLALYIEREDFDEWCDAEPIRG